MLLASEKPLEEILNEIKKEKMKKTLIKFLIIISAGVIIFIILFFIFQNNKSFLNRITLLDFLRSKPENSAILLFAIGDIMLDRDVELIVKKEGEGDFRFPFLRIADHLKKADILFGNLESIISDKEGEKVKKTGPVQVYFKAEPKAIEGLRYAGFDVISVANNHTLDYGREVMEDSLRRLKEASIEYVGAGADSEEVFSVKIQELKGNKIGFLAYTYPKFDGCYISWKPTENKPGVAVIEKKEIDKIKKDITEAKKKVDILIISLHWGKEYSLEPIPFKISLAKSFIDAGADLIIGHHPHVVQPLEKYRNGWIAYSLGNFVFDQDFPGGLLEVIIKGKKIKEVRLRKTKISNYFQPYLSNDLQD